jgi:anthranilate synthase/aminodeoxychorismate synthase-like glutamine amidotransferase
VNAPLLIDNHDSFTHNLAHLLARAWREPEVLRADRVTPQEILRRRPPALVLSPGPGRPRQAVNLMAILDACAGRLPILGVCLGHQAIGQWLGLPLERVAPVHGHACPLEHSGLGLFAGCPPGLRVMRYHSLCLRLPRNGRLPLRPLAGVLVDARCAPNLPMALRHEGLGLWGLQFHPESFLSEGGLEMLRNFRRAAQAGPRRPGRAGRAARDWRPADKA